MATISKIDGIAGNMAQLNAKSGVNKSDKDVSASDAFSSLLKLAGGGINLDAGSKTGTPINTDFNKASDTVPAPARPAEAASKPAKSGRDDAYSKPSQDNAYDKKQDSAVKTDRPQTDNSAKSVKNNDKPADKVADNTDKATAVTDNAPVTEEAVDDTAVVTEVIAGVFDILKEALSVDDAELSNLLEETGVSVEELLSPEGLQSFILKVGGNTEVDMLVDENLAQAVNDAVEGLENLLDENGIKDTNEFAAKVAEISAKQEETDFVQTEEKTERPELVLGRENKTENDDAQNVNAYNTEEQNVAESQATRNTGSQAGTGSESSGTFAQTTAQPELSQQSAEVRQDFTGAMNNLNQAVAANPEAQGTVYVEGVGEVKQSDIISQVIDDIKANSKGGVDSLEVVLNPEQLGKVHINVVSKNGVMQAQITAETEAAKNAIEQGIISLKENLEQQGLKVDEVEVMLANYEFFNEEREAELEERRGGRRGNSNSSDDEGDGNEGNAALTEDRTVLESKGSSVSYTA
ncbi:MAG: flagellar hook-length control protein FliK [Lachnospiraceae bacterium]|nr:flagellar hook-length control protein FliK [Lachnospiraceae bacterium]